MGRVEGERLTMSTGEDDVRVCLLSGFEVECGKGRLQFPATGARLIAYLALQRRPISRVAVAGVLWPETTQDRAQASLRSTLWRVRKVHDSMVRSEHQCLALADEVAVDVRALLDAAQRVDDGIKSDHQTEIPVSWFSYELLPDWYEDWVTFERESFRLMALHALEGMAASYTAQCRYRDAVECSLAAVRLEPMRESSHRALVSAHIAQGNLAEAVRQYYRCRDFLLTELGVEPSDHMNKILLSAGLAESIARVA
jgi:DNA-binding SARP family transcriptional activator